MDNNIEIPKHISIIMDGNGRWATARNLPRSMGHREGMKRVVDIVEHASNLGVKYLSLYAFSTENWKRPEDEIKGLMELLVIYIRNQLNKLHKNNVILKLMGDINGIPEKPRAEIERAIEKTKNNTGMTLNLGINYGGRQELVKAVNSIISDIEKKILTYPIKEEEIMDRLYTSGQPEPDLLIRPGHEKRLSNFMIVQSAYTELYFTETLWPDFYAEDLDLAIKEFNNRKRRFGGI